MSSLITTIGESGMDFSKLLLKQNKEKNIIISPISITGSLAMLLYGAGNGTANQIAKVLHFNEVESASSEGSCAAEPECDAFRLTDAGSQCDQPGGIHSQFHALISQFIKPTKDYDLSIANRLEQNILSFIHITYVALKNCIIVDWSKLNLERKQKNPENRSILGLKVKEMVWRDAGAGF